MGRLRDDVREGIMTDVTSIVSNYNLFRELSRRCCTELFYPENSFINPKEKGLKEFLEEFSRLR